MNNKNRVCIYLRKSRADEELEKTLGEGETLSKHRRALLKFAKEKKLNIVEIKEEIVSGENIIFRPKMIELLQEVEEKKYTGVLVMDIQRLGRGDMKDQGVILETFKNSNTKIITPMKTYDLNNEIDEEYTEFEAFMSRKELKMINRRMQGGRVRSVEDGNYIATNPPLGYDIDFIGKSRTLKINESESEIIKLIFNMYINGEGSGAISNRLNSLGYKTKIGNDFSPSSVLNIIKNPIYIGKITWKKKDIRKSKDPNKVKDTRTRDKSEWMIVDGKHPAIIEDRVFNKATEILQGKYHIPYQLTNGPTNPLAGILTCGVCGRKMVMRPLRGIYRVMCINKCGNKSSRWDYVENAIVDALEEYLENYSDAFKASENKTDVKLYQRQLKVLEKEFEALNTQKLKLFDLLERGIYNEDTFLERSKNIDSRINKIMLDIDTLKTAISREEKQKNKNNIIEFRNYINAYKRSKDVQKKNKLMRDLVYKIEYEKKPEQKNSDFEIRIYPKLKR